MKYKYILLIFVFVFFVFCSDNAKSSISASDSFSYLCRLTITRLSDSKLLKTHYYRLQSTELREGDFGEVFRFEDRSSLSINGFIVNFVNNQKAELTVFMSDRDTKDSKNLKKIGMLKIIGSGMSGLVCRETEIKLTCQAKD